MDRLFHNVEQNSDSWFDLRLGKVTSSNFGCIMANLGKSFGEPAKRYGQRIAIESVTKKRIETYTNSNMDRGNELEPYAVYKYQEETGSKIEPGGFMEYGRFGDSADGLVNKDGCVEIKSVLYNTHFDRIIKGGYDTAYQWQIQGHIWIHDRQWCDYVSYCPEFPKSKSLYIHKVMRDDVMIKKLETRLNDFVSLVDEYKDTLGVEYEEPEEIVSKKHLF